MKTTACENFVRKACQSRFFFCEKEFASIEILIQLIAVTPPNPSDNAISRRTFLKTSAFTVGSVTLLSSGIALAAESGSNIQWKKRRYGCKIAFLGPSDESFENQDILDGSLAWETENPVYWSSPANTPPGGDRVNDPEGNDPEIIETWNEPHAYSMTSYRVPQAPQPCQWIDPVTYKFYAGYLYDYVEEKHDQGY